MQGEVEEEDTDDVVYGHVVVIVTAKVAHVANAALRRACGEAGLRDEEERKLASIGCVDGEDVWSTCAQMTCTTECGRDC